MSRLQIRCPCYERLKECAGTLLATLLLVSLSCLNFAVGNGITSLCAILAAQSDGQDIENSEPSLRPVQQQALNEMPSLTVKTADRTLIEQAKKQAESDSKQGQQSSAQDQSRERKHLDSFRHIPLHLKELASIKGKGQNMGPVKYLQPITPAKAEAPKEAPQLPTEHHPNLVSRPQPQSSYLPRQGTHDGIVQGQPASVQRPHSAEGGASPVIYRAPDPMRWLSMQHLAAANGKEASPNSIAGSGMPICESILTKQNAIAAKLKQLRSNAVPCSDHSLHRQFPSAFSSLYPSTPRQNQGAGLSPGVLASPVPKAVELATSIGHTNLPTQGGFKRKTSPM